MFKPILLSFSNVQVSPEEFGQRIGLAITELSKVLGSALLPLASVSFVVAVILFIAGTVFKSENMKKSGIGSMGIIAFGILLYYAIPLILALLEYIGQFFAV